MNKQQEKFDLAINNNDIKNVKLLLKDKRVNPSNNNNSAILLASQNGHLEIVKLLLKDKRVDPSESVNYAIEYAFKNGHLDIVKKIWRDKKIKLTLKNNNSELYNELIQEDIKNKVHGF